MDLALKLDLEFFHQRLVEAFMTMPTVSKPSTIRLGSAYRISAVTIARPDARLMALCIALEVVGFGFGLLSLPLAGLLLVRIWFGPL